MRRIDIAKRAVKNISKTKIRTILTSLAIAVGATTISLAMAAGNGGNAYVNSVARKIGDPNSITISRKVVAAETKDPYAPEKLNERKTDAENMREYMLKHGLTQADIDKIATVKGVKSVNPVVSVSLKSVRLSTMPAADAFKADGVVQYNEKEIELSAGKLDGNKIPDGQVVAPQSYVQAFGLKSADELVGKEVIFTFNAPERTADANGDIPVAAGEAVGDFERKFTIAAVDKGKIDTEFAYANAFRFSNNDGQKLFEVQSPEQKIYPNVILVADGSRAVDTIKRDVENLDASRYEVSTFADGQKTVQTAVNIAAAGLAGFGVLTILASVFGIINTQYISVLERTGQIGLMKSLGARRSEIAKLFRYEAAAIGALGGVIGVAIGYAFTLLNPLIGQVIHLDGVALLQMNFWQNLILVLSLMLVAVVSGYLPARKAARMNPIEALRQE